MARPVSPPARGEPRLLRWLSGGVGALSAGAIAVAAAGLLVSLALIGWSIVMRYVFNKAPVWVDDAVGFMLVAIVMMATADVLRRSQHIGVDIVTERLGPTASRWAQAWSALAVLVVSIILILNGWQTAMESRQFGIITDGQIQWPVWWLMMLMPLGGVLMTLVSIELLWRLALGMPLPESTAEIGDLE
jgi:TRAP-type C4-dicarboxylate transport system permease small subunit